MKSNTFLSKVGISIVALALIGGSFFFGTYVGIQSHADAGDQAFASASELGKPADVDFTIFWKAWNTLNEKYVKTHGLATSTLNATTTSATSSSVSNQDRVYGAIKGMTESLGDPYTVFFPPQQSKDFEDEISGNFEGVGMEVGVKDNMLTVISAIKGTPAFRAGLQPGDKILKINDTITSGLSIDEAIKLIKGPKGTTVIFTIGRGKDSPIQIKVVRDVIDIPTIETTLRPDGVFVIKLFTFTSQSPSLFRNALREFVLSKSNKLVLDLRGNPGGYLDAAVDIASWFLPNGKAVVRESFGPGKEEVVSRSRGYDIFNSNLKFVILMNGGSASASEILAGALSEYGKAQLVGTKSFGKGSVQELIKITPDTALKVTIARWLTPNGISISEGGLKPDVTVELTEADFKAGKDPQLEKAVEMVNK